MKRAQMMWGVVLAAGLLAVGSFYLGRTSVGRVPAASAEGRKVLYWHDPMVPGQRFDKPGKSPFMDMELVPVYAESDAGGAAASGVSISPTVQQNLGIRLAPVRRASVASSLDAVGTVQFDERLGVAVQTRVPGYVERLSVRAPMQRVRKGQALATVFAPDWLAPQNELLALIRAGAAPELIAAARERMRAMSIPDALVRRSEASGVAQARFDLTAPISGVVAELGVREGAAVAPGTTLFRIAGLERVWVVAEVPEAHAIRLMPGQKVRATLQADATRSFVGELKEILPEVAAATRTLKARFEVDNRAGQLTPGMLLRLDVVGPATARLLVPSEAVIRTGRRAVVIVRKEDGRFEPREVTLGQEFGDESEIAGGVQPGEQVVASGQFLIDSEARLRSVLGSLAAASSPAAAGAASSASSAAGVHHAEGRVEAVEPDEVVISHGPVPSLAWPPMTMGFSKPPSAALPALKPGDRIRFQFKEGGPSGYELVSVVRAEPDAKR